MGNILPSVLNSSSSVPSVLESGEETYKLTNLFVGLAGQQARVYSKAVIALFSQAKMHFYDHKKQKPCIGFSYHNGLGLQVIPSPPQCKTAIG